MASVTSRQMQALLMRREGKKLSEIGRTLGVSVGRVHRLIQNAKRTELRGWTAGLTPSVVNALSACGIDQLSKLESAIADGSLRRMPGIGQQRYQAIMTWMRQK